LTDPDLIAQTAMRRLRDSQDQLIGQAHAYAMGQQSAADQAFQGYQQAISAPIQNPIPPMAALPYLANAFAAGYADHPEHAAAAERQVMLNQDQLQQRRQEVLGSLHEKYLQAARQAQDAGDLERSLQFTAKAN